MLGPFRDMKSISYTLVNRRITFRLPEYLADIPSFLGIKQDFRQVEVEFTPDEAGFYLVYVFADNLGAIKVVEICDPGRLRVMDLE